MLGDGDPELPPPPLLDEPPAVPASSALLEELLDPPLLLEPWVPPVSSVKPPFVPPAPDEQPSHKTATNALSGVLRFIVASTAPSWPGYSERIRLSAARILAVTPMCDQAGWTAFRLNWNFSGLLGSAETILYPGLAVRAGPGCLRSAPRIRAAAHHA
jgi:hypothetical protein